MPTRIALTLLAALSTGSAVADIAFTPVQPEVFADPGGQSNAWGDFDGDGDLDLVVTFNSAPVRLMDFIESLERGLISPLSFGPIPLK